MFNSSLIVIIKYEERKMIMGLDVMVFKMVKPRRKFETFLDVDDYCRKNDFARIYLNDYSYLLDKPVVDRFKVTIPDASYDFEKYFSDRGLVNTDYEWICTCGCTFTFEHTITKETVDVVADDVPLKLSNTDVIFYRNKELGYQRKGANNDFYKDGMWDDYNVVIDIETLKEHAVKYFADSDFNKLIVDKFIDGKTFVGYF